MSYSRNQEKVTVSHASSASDTIATVISGYYGSDIGTPPLSRDSWKSFNRWLSHLPQASIEDKQRTLDKMLTETTMTSVSNDQPTNRHWISQSVIENNDIVDELDRQIQIEINDNESICSQVNITFV